MAAGIFHKKCGHDTSASLREWAHAFVFARGGGQGEFLLGARDFS